MTKEQELIDNDFNSLLEKVRKNGLTKEELNNLINTLLETRTNEDTFLLVEEVLYLSRKLDFAAGVLDAIASDLYFYEESKVVAEKAVERLSWTRKI